LPAPATIALSGLAALAIAMGIGRFAFTPILPMMQQEAGLSLAQGGWLAAANYFGYLVGALWAMRPVNPTVAVRAALAAITLATAGMGVWHDFTAWMVLRAAAGFASAWALVHVSSWCLARLAPSRSPVLDGAVFTGVGTGIAVAGAACLALMWAHATAGQAWLALGALSLLVTAVVWPVFSADGTGGAPAPAARGDRLPANSWRLVLCYGAFGFGYIIPATFVPAMARQAIPDPLAFGWAWPLFGATAAASTLVAGLLPRAVDNRRLWMMSAVAMALGVASPLLLDGLGGVFVSAFLVGGTFMLITMAGMQEARRVAHANAPRLMAAMTSAFALGQVIGPLCMTVMTERWALGVAAALLLLSVPALARR